MSQDSYLKRVFNEPPLTAFKWNRNLRNLLIRAKVAPKQGIHPKRKMKGMKKCGENCPSCPYILEKKSVTINQKTWNINRKLDCNSSNLVYAIFCIKENCQKVYIGETKRLLKFRIADHRGYVLNQRTDKSTGHHFNMPGHSLADLRVTALQHTQGRSNDYRKEREHYLIQKF